MCQQYYAKFVKFGMERMIQAWNSHPIPRRGVPNKLQLRAFHTTPTQPAEIPSANDAETLYRDRGGRLTYPAIIGSDPLETDPNHCTVREDKWLAKYGMIVHQFFSNVISGNHLPLENAILHFTDITSDLADE